MNFINLRSVFNRKVRAKNPLLFIYKTVVKHLMNIFNRHIKVRHIKRFENNFLEIIKNDLPKIYEVSKLKELVSICTHYNNGIPSGITLLHRYINNDAYNTVKQNHQSHFFIYGLAVWHKKSNEFKKIRLHCSNDSVQGIDVEKPEKFHSNFDLNKIKLDTLKIEELPIGPNPDKEIVEKILSELNKNQLEQLELKYTFEFEDDGKLLYSIIDMEDGNCIAVDKNGAIYRWNHDSDNRILEIAKNPTEFFKFYNGQKTELKHFMNQ